MTDAKKDDKSGFEGFHIGSISAGRDSNIANGDITTSTSNITSGLSVAEINQLFNQLYTTIEADKKVSSSKKEDIKAELEEIQTKVVEAVNKNQLVEESYLARKFKNIVRMAPDILDVVVATVGNPLAGLGVAVKKIADKAKEETKA